MLSGRDPFSCILHSGTRFKHVLERELQKRENPLPKHFHEASSEFASRSRRQGGETKGELKGVHIGERGVGEATKQMEKI